MSGWGRGVKDEGKTCRGSAGGLWGLGVVIVGLQGGGTGGWLGVRVGCRGTRRCGGREGRRGQARVPRVRRDRTRSAARPARPQPSRLPRRGDAGWGRDLEHAGDVEDAKRPDAPSLSLFLCLSVCLSLSLSRATWKMRSARTLPPSLSRPLHLQLSHAFGGTLNMRATWKMRRIRTHLKCSIWGIRRYVPTCADR